MNMKVNETSQLKDKHFLIAVDGSESSKRAVLYVADMIGGFPGFTVTLLSIIPAPESDFFESADEEAAWMQEKMAAANRLLENYRNVMVHAGFLPEKVRLRSCVGEDRSFAEAILDMRCDLSCCTVVVGRHHKSKTEEFLLGSTSTKLIREAKNCAIWVVE
jgi:nucleotide-binding universal stress UspA family protein